MYSRCLRPGRLAPLIVAVTFISGCAAESAAPVSNPPAASNAAATNRAPAAVPGGMPGNMPTPMGMEDSIEGTVVSMVCLERNPNMSPDEAKACAVEATKAGGPLAVLTADGILYIDSEEVDARSTNKKLQIFTGEVVVIQGQLIGDAKREKLGSIPMKQFRMKLVRRKVNTKDGPANRNRAGGR